MLLLDLFKEDLKKQDISADIQVGGEDTVFVSANVEDVVKAQVLVILCDKYHFAKGLAPLDEGGGVTIVASRRHEDYHHTPALD